MTRTTKTTRLALLAASTAAAAGAVLFPATAFAAAPAGAAAVVADDGGIAGNGTSGGRSGSARLNDDTLPDGVGHGGARRDGDVFPGGVVMGGPDTPPQPPKPWWATGQWGKHGDHQMQCFAAPCEPPGGDPETGGGSLSVFG